MMPARVPALIAVAILSAVTTPRLQSVAQTTSGPRATGFAAEVSLDEILAGALARARAQDEAKAELQFESVVATTVNSLDGDGTVTKTEMTVHRRYPIEEAVYEELIERDGEPLSDEALRDEARKREEFRHKARDAAANGTDIETNDERQVRFNADLMGRYHAELVSEAVVRDQRCWVLAFHPRQGRLPERTRMDKALNQSSGRVYIAQDDYGIMRIEFELLRPVRYMWGLIASLRRATGRLDFERVDQDVWLPERFDLRIDLRVLFRTTRQHVVRRWVERSRLRGTTAVSSGPATASQRVP